MAKKPGPVLAKSLRSSNKCEGRGFLVFERVGTTEDYWLTGLAALRSPGVRQEAMKGSVEDWSTESLLAARAAYHVTETGMRLKSAQKLGGAYL